MDFTTSTETTRDRLRCSLNDSGGVVVFITKALHRDPASWMHIVIAVA